MIQYYTYIYKDPSKDMEPFLVGKGCKKRAYFHLNRKDKHPLTQRLQKMFREGIQPEIKIINVVSEQAAFDWEIFLIACYGRKDLGTGTLLNLTNGGENPPVHFGEDNYNFGRTGEKNHRYGKPGYWSGKIGHWLGKKRPEASKRMKENNPNSNGVLHRDTIWITNGECNKRIKKNGIIPSGFIKGMK